jgi:uncharacterized protein
VENDESRETRNTGSSGGDDVQAENMLGALIRIASRLEATPAMREPEDSKQGRRRRLGEVAAMAAVVLAASAVGVALWGQTPAKASSKPVIVKAVPKVPTCNGSTPRLTVQGSGVATGTPDQLTLVTEVDVTESTAEAALASDNAQTAAVEHALISDGVAAKNLQTTNLSIQPNYTTVNNNVTLTGYSVSDTISANFGAPFASAGKAIDDVTAIAGNDVRIDSLSFSFADPRVLEDQARTDAVTQAVTHAQSMAMAAGEQLGPVCSVTDNAAVPTYPMAFNGDEASYAAAGTPLSPGTQQETDQVTVVYALKPLAANG